MKKEELEQLIIKIVHDTIKDCLYGTNSVDKEEILKEVPNFKNPAATFVTLNLDGDLRGCVGSLLPVVSFYDDITANAKKAAFEDSRFSPLTKEEFENIEIEVSILSEPLEIKYLNISDLKSKVNIGIDGMIISQGKKRATFLPQVWEQLPVFEDFLTHLFAKAGITDLETPIDVFVYQVEKIK